MKIFANRAKNPLEKLLLKTQTQTHKNTIIHFTFYIKNGARKQSCASGSNFSMFSEKVNLVNINIKKMSLKSSALKNFYSLKKIMLLWDPFGEIFYQNLENSEK